MRSPAAAWLLAPWHCIGLGIGILYWAVCGSLLTVTAAILHVILPRSVAEKTGKRILHGLFRIFLRLIGTLGLVKADIRALDALRSEKGVILAPNHAALWDAVFIVSRLPRVTCVMKPSILKNPFLGGGARLAGYIAGLPVTHMIRLAEKQLAAGGQLLFFPEGTRTSPDARWINPLGGGCALIARRARVPVQTIFIRTDSRFLQKGWSVFKRPPFPIRVHIELGPVLIPGENESPQDFTQRVSNIFEQHLPRPHPLRRQIES